MVDVKAAESTCEVLIIGAGPAGLMLAAWMARCGVAARIVDKRSTKVHVGQADGLNSRSMEIFDSLGFADRVEKEANIMAELCMWNPGEDGIIQRSERMPLMPSGLSRFKDTALLHQGRIERFFLDNIKKHSNDKLHVERAVIPESLRVDDNLCDDHSASNYPITVQLRHLAEHNTTPAQTDDSAVSNGLFKSNLADDDTADLIAKSRKRQDITETVKAKYVVGCDGAHSWTRRQLGFELEGESTDSIWGVLDIIPISDFPDIRYSSTIRSAEHGSLLMIPRERGLVRVYIQLTEVKLGANGRADRSKITPASILQAAQRIMAPYTLKYEYCEWWTAYQIGQRVGTHFDYKSRVFLAGDAVHTHSPKAGQGKWACLNFQATRASQLLTGSVGMNVSMQDSFNLGWKLGLVVKGVAHASILHTYGIERRAIAKELIAFDQKWSRLFSGRPAKDIMDAEGISVEQFRQVMEANVMFFTGLSVDYGGSILVGEERRELASNIKVGMRLASQRVVNQSDGREWELQRKLVSDGRFRIIVFAGNVTSGEQQMRLQGFCRGLRASELLGRYLGKNNIAVLTCHSAQRNQVELLRDVPEVLHPFDSRRGWDYDSVFADDDGHAYGAYGVDRERGCVVVTRPDQHVGQIESVDEAGVAGVEGYFRSVLLVE